MTHSNVQASSSQAADKKLSGTSSSTAPAGAVQMRAELRGREFAAQEQMLQPRAVQRKRPNGAPDAIQRQSAERDGGTGAGTAGRSAAPVTANAAGETANETPSNAAPSISYSVPSVVNVAAIANPVSRNQAINQSYHQIDTAMTAYLGTPLVSNWCTYGQHASREAGAQIKNLKAAKQLLADVGSHLTDFQTATLAAATPLTFLVAVRSSWNIARRAWNDVKMIIGLLGEEGLVKQSVLLWMARAGISLSELISINDRFTTIASMDIGDVSLDTASSVYDILVTAINLGIRIASGVPGLISSMDVIYDNMCRGNREIYENVAPAFASFLSAGLGGNGVVGRMGFAGDSRGFLSAAFDKYSQVRDKANQLAVTPAGDPGRGALTASRNALAHEANLIIGYQEQLVILQPIFDTMQVELAAMSGTMVLRDPNGTHPLTGNWQNFYTRMGLDPSRTPPLSEINASNLGELAEAGQRHGSISEYFEQGLNNRRIHNAPRAISEHGS